MGARPFLKPIETAAHRIAEAMTMHTLAGSVGYWAAFRMSDGHPVTNTAYASREIAVQAAGWDRDTTVYLEVQADGMQAAEAQDCLNFQRQLHDAGFRIPDPSFAFDIARPMFAWDRFKTISHLASGGRKFAEG